MEYARGLLEEVGIERDRLEMYHISASDAPLWVKIVVEMTERVRALGPNPLRESLEKKPENRIEGAGL